MHLATLCLSKYVTCCTIVSFVSLEFQGGEIFQGGQILSRGGGRPPLPPLNEALACHSPLISTPLYT